MADIIPFKPTVRNGDTPRAGTAAEIVIFPGVRYERTEETEENEPPRNSERSGRRGRRGRLS